MVKSSESGPPGDMSDLPALQPLPTAAERAADVIRQNIFEGRFAPGTALPEATLSRALRVSRNTVREAFRTLIGEHLLAYETHKGVMVRRLTADDVRDIYKLRRMFELTAIDLAIGGHPGLDVVELSEIVAAAEQAAEDGLWPEVGTANLRFHAAVVETHRSDRINEIFRRLMTELRLGFLAAEDPASFHGPFLVRNRKIHDYVAGGRMMDARQELAAYLDDAEGPVVRAVQGFQG